MRKSCLPNVFTFANLSCGVFSLLCTIQKNYLWASIFIILAALVDRYDGRIARFFQVSSELGKELDSLADLVSFGVAPSILMFTLYSLNNFGPYGILGYILVIAYPICGAFRLARYNVSSFDGVFTGVPITIAGSIIAIFALLTFNRVSTMTMVLGIIFIIAFSYLMVSNFKLKKV
ncbi:CDP-diacylglycerol--serine O-phosphatidyltransferase [Clostridium fallax]|uniref:CDP-diacylglycerol--serine O-phosphatidyltransferase n=1 Tax=Clostridium fallax TaxID=1533 RepID=A0A1M4SSB9_9CLOT|nr:CDP-diacylglycerol--serine O-phosphatidyltransferase [Clostridium fallax]SHE35153.1 CDP-diacylglycerol--serine O-phosphatidyltransferase [Clostridium fallax]SQB07949.1 CDP-diacylglycerol--serine O-phosphatidyltransferase [Clostridium fallax]